MGRKGLESIENVGPRLAKVVEELLLERKSTTETAQLPSRMKVTTLEGSEEQGDGHH
jgi:hypothetical protein